MMKTFDELYDLVSASAGYTPGECQDSALEALSEDDLGYLEILCKVAMREPALFKQFYDAAAKEWKV